MKVLKCTIESCLLISINGLTSAAPLETAPSSYPRDSIEIGFSYEHLTRGLPAWTSYFARIERYHENQTLIYAGLRETERYALHDQELTGGTAFSVNSHLRAQVEAGLSGTHQILPGHFADISAQYQMHPQWSVSGGFRHSQYNIGHTRIVRLGVERYFGNELLSFTIYGGAPNGSGLSSSYRGQWGHYYGDHSWFGIVITHGRETENAGGTQFITSRILSTALVGRHDITPAWGVLWELGRVNQGTAYTRTGARIGLRYAF